MPPLRTELRCGLLVDGTGTPAREHVSVVLEGSQVASVRPWSDRGSSNADVVDLSDATVIPGVVDAHTHLCYGSTQSPGWLEAAGDPHRVIGWGLAACASAVAAGITTVVDCGSPSGLALTVRDLVAGGMAVGPRVLAAGEAITTTGGHGAELGVAADTAAEVRAAVRGLVARGADLVKIMVTGGAIDPHTNRRQAQYDEDELRVGVVDAHRLGRVVVGHANATTGIVRAVRSGFDVVAHCNWLGAEPGTVVVDVATVDAMARQGTYVDLNLDGARRPLADTDGIPTEWPWDHPFPTCRWELLAPMRAAGVAMYLSSDAFGPAIGSFPAGLGKAAEEWKLPVEELVHRSTTLPARAFGLADRGRVAAGYVGDLAVFPGDLRTDPSALARPTAVYQRGSRVVDNGWLRPAPLTRDHGDQMRAQRDLIQTAFDDLD